MMDRSRFNINGDGEDSTVVDDNEGDPENKCTRFCVESEEAMNDAERKRWCKDAKKYEKLIDTLFAENEDQLSGDS